MPPKNRVDLIKRIEEMRSSKVIAYLTSVRPNVPAQISEDAVREIADHLLRLPSRPVPRLDLFLCSNGGSGTVPWRLVSLFREFAQEFNVLLPYRAYSAATLIALGADSIVMHPFAEMGPIDPTVVNDFNPADSQTGRRIGISVEDVKAYVNFIKSTVGITHEDELVKTIEILANKVHPLALGNVERFLSQSRMVARKILLTHMPSSDNHQIEEIIETMASKLYFHGHPINRVEAKKELNLKVISDPQPELETAIWNLYLAYESELKNREKFLPIQNLMAKLAAAHSSAQAAAAAGHQVPPSLPIFDDHKLIHAIIESTELTTVAVTERRYTITGLGQNQEPLIREDVIRDSWDQT